MAHADSVVDHEAMAYARALLKPPLEKDGVLPALGAALFAAVSALAFALAMVLAPPVTTSKLALEPATQEIATGEAN